MTTPAAPPSTAPTSSPAPVEQSRGNVTGAPQIVPGGTPPIIPVLLIGAGAYLLWFAVKYWRGSGPAVWPSYPIKSVLQGKGLPANSAAVPPSEELTTYEEGLQESAGLGKQYNLKDVGKGLSGGPQGQPKNIARLLLPKYGWTSDQAAPLALLWTRESGWNPKARNATSGAFGIAQALGHGTQCSAAADGTNEYGTQYGLNCEQARAANEGNALQQIKWGLGYIKDRYGSPSSAWAHEQAYSWYVTRPVSPAKAAG